MRGKCTCLPASRPSSARVSIVSIQTDLRIARTPLRLLALPAAPRAPSRRRPSKRSSPKRHGQPPSPWEPRRRAGLRSARVNAPTAACSKMATDPRRCMNTQSNHEARNDAVWGWRQEWSRGGGCDKGGRSAGQRADDIQGWNWTHLHPIFASLCGMTLHRAFTPPPPHAADRCKPVQDWAQ